MSASQRASDSMQPSQAQPLAQRIQSKSLVKALQQALKALPLYGPGSPATNRSLETLHDIFRSVWTSRNTISLQFAEDGVWVDEVRVLEAKSPDASLSDTLAQAFHQDSIQQVTFHRGFEEEELSQFLSLVVHAASQKQRDDDLATLLWSEDLDYLTYEVAESQRPEADADADADADAAALNQTQSLTQSQRSGNGAPDDPAPLPEALLSQPLASADLQLAAAEAVYLEELVQEEVRRNVRGDVITGLLDSLQDGGVVIQLEIVELLEVLASDLVQAVELPSIASLLVELRTLSEATQDLSPDICKSLQRSLGRIELSPAVTAFLGDIESGEVVPDLQELAGFVDCLGPANTLALLRASELMKNKKVAAILRQASEKIVAQHPEILLDLLHSDDVNVVMSAARLVNAAHGEEAVREVIRLLKHRQPNVRLVATKSLLCVGNKLSLEALLGALQDDSEEVCQASAWALATWGYRPALESLRGVLESPRFQGLALNEKITYFDAYAKIGGSDSVALLGEILNKRNLFRPRFDNEMRACAARGLGQVKALAARRALEKAATDSDAKVRRVVQRQLRGVRES